MGIFIDIYFKDALTGLISSAGNVFKTTNSGKTWFGTNMPLGGSFPLFRKITVVNNSHAWVVGNHNIAYKSTDFGSNWFIADTLAIQGETNMYCIEFANALTGWAGGTFGFLTKSTNGGLSWARENTGADQRFFGSIYFYNDTIGWGTGGAGKMMHTTTGGQTLVNITENYSSIPAEFSISQNHPNPFNPITTILFKISKPSYVEVNIFNIQGVKLSNLASKKYNTGVYKLNFNGDSYESGVYFYNFIVDGVVVETKKMVLLK